MNAPNREAEVVKIWDTAFPQGHTFSGDDERRVFLLDTLIPELNKLDEGQWGSLIKTDRTPPFIPSDIVVWQDSREHFDVLTDHGPAWQPDGVMDNPSWVWGAVGTRTSTGTEPDPLPSTSPTPPVDLTGIVDQLKNLTLMTEALIQYIIGTTTTTHQTLAGITLQQHKSLRGKVFGVNVTLTPDA